MACVCGHAIEEHDDDDGPCIGDDGECECLGYEEDEDEEDEP